MEKPTTEIRKPDVNGYYQCANYETCASLVDEYGYTDEELSDPEELILCNGCAKEEADLAWADIRETLWDVYEGGRHRR